jgi:hypothetical protein
MKSNILLKLLNRRINLAVIIGLSLALNTPLLRADDHKNHNDHNDHNELGSNSGQIMWVNHFDLLSGDLTDLITTYNSTNSGVGGGLTGLVIQSASIGNTFPIGGNKVVQMALELPKQTKVTGVRVCYETNQTTDAPTFISQIRLAQVQNPPSSASVLLDDATPLTDNGPVCVNSATVKQGIKASNGPILLSLRINTGNIDDLIVIRGLGILVK